MDRRKLARIALFVGAVCAAILISVGLALAGETMDAFSRALAAIIASGAGIVIMSIWVVIQVIRKLKTDLHAGQQRLASDQQKLTREWREFRDSFDERHRALVEVVDDDWTALTSYTSQGLNRILDVISQALKSGDPERVEELKKIGSEIGSAISIPRHRKRG